MNNQMYKENTSEEQILKVQESLEKEETLMLSGLDVNDPSLLHLSVKDILYNVILQNDRRDTRCVKSHILQCYCEHKRSQGDLYNLMRYYYPQITLLQLRQLLLDLINKGKLSSLLCGGIKKRVFYPPDRFDIHRVPAGKMHGDNVLGCLEGESQRGESQWKAIEKGIPIPDEYKLSFIET